MKAATPSIILSMLLSVHDCDMCILEFKLAWSYCRLVVLG